MASLREYVGSYYSLYERERERRSGREEEDFTRYFPVRPLVASYSWSATSGQLWLQLVVRLEIRFTPPCPPSHPPLPTILHSTVIWETIYTAPLTTKHCKRRRLQPSVWSEWPEYKVWSEKPEQPASKRGVWFTELGLTVVAKYTSYAIYAGAT